MESSARTLPQQITTSAMATAVKPSYLLSPALDFAMVGGASLVVFLMAYLFVDKNSSTAQISWTMFYLAFVVNNPHFMASYLLLYGDKRKELFTNKRFFWAAIGAPALILAYMGVCIAVGSPRFLSYAVNVMYFTVGWHYIKQIYGTMVVAAARRGYYLTVGESRLLKANLFPVWFMSFIGGNLGIREIMHYGIGYQTFNLPPLAMTINYVLVVVSLLAVGAVVFRKWIQSGALPGWTATASLTAIYVWYLPGLYHAVFWFMIPFFHSLQYMLFVATLKRNEFMDEAQTASAGDAVVKRKILAKRVVIYLAAIGVLGFLSFDGVPYFLDKYVLHVDQAFGPQLASFVFITFINIHHYFIDNVLWRRDNPALKKYL